MKKVQSYTMTADAIAFLAVAAKKSGLSRSAILSRLVTEYALAITAVEPVLVAALAASPTARLLADHAQAIQKEWSADHGDA